MSPSTRCPFKVNCCGRIVCIPNLLGRVSSAPLTIPRNGVRLPELIQRADQAGEQDADIVIVLVLVKGDIARQIARHDLEMKQRFRMSRILLGLPSFIGPDRDSI